MSKEKGEMKMSFLKSISMLVALVAVLAVSMTTTAQNSNSKTPETSIVGYISDNHCGLKHMAGMGDDKSCTLMCVKNGKFVLADRDHKRVYQLDKVGQEKAREFAGQKVKVTGRKTGRTIRVTMIEAA
ncbi:MAG TPA: DUF5818 domain-containing protein [Pyrinomonadaceae bacterium]|nr:DUF5818 domain-containing protein [Pyrinomonadaceae bacterium]